jgi:hypothetical protein
MPATLDDPPSDLLSLPAGGPPRNRRVVLVLVLALVLLALTAGGMITVLRQRSSGDPAAAPTDPVATTTLERRDLSTARSLSGAIGYGAARPLTGHLDATVTWLPKVGATITRGEQLFRADDLPVPLFYGDLPMYRDISGANLVGRDVRIIADNLRALGYSIGRQPGPGEWVTPPAPAAPTGSDPTSTGGTEPDANQSDAKSGADQDKNQGEKTTTDEDRVAPVVTGPRKIKDGEGVLTPGLVRAIKRWQGDLGRPATGIVVVGDVEVAGGAVRVDSVGGQPGAAANSALLSVTSTRKVITVGAELSDTATIRRGDRVTVKLPDEHTLKARVTSVGRDLDADESGAGTGSPKLTVTVTVDNARGIARLDSADVEVLFIGKQVKHVLAAPIEALIALREGGYAVQTPTGLVAVDTGMFADGWVEITGAGLAEGTSVVISS